MNNRYENTELRTVLANCLAEKMAKDERIVVLDADLGASMNTMSLRDKFPKRAIEVGIAEQNMASIAGGLASYGFVPFIYSFAPFVTRRIADQIMISMVYGGHSVKIVGTDPGITAEMNGGTHMAFEDIGTLRSMPGVVIFEPSDAIELATAFEQIVDYKGVVYIRTGRKVVRALHDDSYRADLFRADVVKEGKDVTLFASGVMVAEAMDAAEILAKSGINAEVVNVHTVKPLDTATVIASVKKTGCAVTVENHNVMGGLRSAIAEALVENYPVPVESIGVKEKIGEVGKLDYLKKVYNMTKEDIAAAATKVISKVAKNA